MAASQANVVSLSASSTNIPTGSYVALSAITPIACTQVELVNTTASIVVFAIGAAGSEVDLVAVGPSMERTINIGLNVMPVGSRVSLHAIGANATTGYVAMSFLP